MLWDVVVRVVTVIGRGLGTNAAPTPPDRTSFNLFHKICAGIFWDADRKYSDSEGFCILVFISFMDFLSYLYFIKYD